MNYISMDRYNEMQERAVKAESERDALAAKCSLLRTSLIELRMRLHAAGRRPAECFEMSLIDEALNEH